MGNKLFACCSARFRDTSEEGRRKNKALPDSKYRRAGTIVDYMHSNMISEFDMDGNAMRKNRNVIKNSTIINSKIKKEFREKNSSKKVSLSVPHYQDKKSKISVNGMYKTKDKSRNKNEIKNCTELSITNDTSELGIDKFKSLVVTGKTYQEREDLCMNDPLSKREINHNINKKFRTKQNRYLPTR